MIEKQHLGWGHLAWETAGQLWPFTAAGGDSALYRWRQQGGRDRLEGSPGTS